ncbi:hypothetical protein BDU57DRAFT_508571 [Ampelomyces quisqualis]|uniref:Uncharacterized protein n=1 Tax=Ampelomyces quisqualis TaxID=50730 RepID=A0A6A5QX47_AMPQU|nr:hypothetical protein BDU57DRAFT_508571 [Ampelomyces quisqualis]
MHRRVYLILRSLSGSWTAGIVAHMQRTPVLFNQLCRRQSLRPRKYHTVALKYMEGSQH